MDPENQYASLNPMYEGSQAAQPSNPLLNLARMGRFGSMRARNWGPGNRLWGQGTMNPLNLDQNQYNQIYGGIWGGGVNQTQQQPSMHYWDLMKMMTGSPSMAEQRWRMSYGAR